MRVVINVDPYNYTAMLTVGDDAWTRVPDIPKTYPINTAKTRSIYLLP